MSQKRLSAPPSRSANAVSLVSIAQRMAERGISLESIVQRRRAPRAAAPENPMPVEPQPVILITYATTEAAIGVAVLNRMLATGRPDSVRRQPVTA